VILSKFYSFSEAILKGDFLKKANILTIMKKLLKDITCREFIKDSERKTCKFFKNPNACKLLHKPYCQEARPSENKRFTSFTRLKTFSTCRRKYWISYVKSIEPIEKPPWLLVGIAGHDLLRKQESAEVLELREKDEEQFQRLLCLTEAFFSQAEFRFLNSERSIWEFTVSRSIEVADKVYEFRGYLDLLPKGLEDPRYGVEFKFVSTLPEEQELLGYQDQLKTYFWLAPFLEKLQLVFLRKPKIRRQKTETWEEFQSRLTSSLNRLPGDYFESFTFYRSEFDLKQFKKELAYKLSEIERNEGNFEAYYPNCGFLNCEFHEICLTGQVSWDLFRLKGGEIGKEMFD